MPIHLYNYAPVLPVNMSRPYFLTRGCANNLVPGGKAIALGLTLQEHRTRIQKTQVRNPGWISADNWLSLSMLCLSLTCLIKMAEHNQPYKPCSYWEYIVLTYTTTIFERPINCSSDHMCIVRLCLVLLVYCFVAQWLGDTVILTNHVTVRML